MASILFIRTGALTSAEEVERKLPSLSLLNHQVATISADPSELAAAARHELVLLDGSDLHQARGIARILAAAGSRQPVLLAVSESSIGVVTEDWGLQDFVLFGASPAELEARIRFCLSATRTSAAQPSRAIAGESGLLIDEESYQARISGRVLDLTYKEFELLRYLAENPGRVFTREQLLGEVWGQDYFGGTRTVDVHIRRLRAKLGEAEWLIGTVRNVGYRLDSEH
jgi:DNA-binding response OmpR family regulator